MQTRPLPRFVTAILSLVLIAAWFVAANHCLLASVPITPVATGHCPGHGVPEKKEKGPCTDQKCCKSLSAPTVALAKNLIDGNTLAFSAIDYSAVTVADLGQQHTAPSCEFDTGPPGRSSFAESVLQRSLLAHAPPLFA